MLEYTMCAGYAALPGNTNSGFDDLTLSVKGDVPDGTVVLYRTDKGISEEAPLRDGKAIFDREFILPGGEYVPRIYDKNGSVCRASSFTVKEDRSGSLFAVRRREALISEVCDLWSAMISLSQSVRENGELCKEACERVKGLIDGYRTE